MVIGVVGLGLMGGSIAISLKKGGHRVIGYDRNSRHREEALQFSLVDEVVSLQEVQMVDILFLAIPVDAIIATLPTLKNLHKDTTVIDLGSTKVEIARAIPDEIREQFVLAHPMAGTEMSGPQSAFDGLYSDRVVVLCDLDDSGDFHNDKAESIFKELKMKIRYMESDDHDCHTSWISHLPHIISFSLANSVLKQEDPKSILDLSAGGFRDMSRLAKSSPTMWKDISKQNRENLLQSIEFFEKDLASFKEIIRDKDWERLEDKMLFANRLHNILK
jgi:prephenate dehydrogenase